MAENEEKKSENEEKKSENEEIKSNLVGFGGNSIGGIAQSTGGVISTAINAFMTARENRKNREWTEHQNNLAYQRQRQLIDEQRAYDTPKEQMRRLMEAGLNPNLIYGGVDQSPMSAQTAPNAAGKYAGVAPQIDPYVASEIAKNMAETRKLDKDSELSAAQAKRLYKITDAEYGKLKADADFIRQRITLSSYDAKVADFKQQLFDDIGYGEDSGVDDNGNIIMRSFANELRHLIANNEVYKLQADESQYRQAIELFLTNVGIRKAEKTKIDLENKDLQAFVDVCSRIYEGQASQADYIKSVSELNQQFYGSLGASNDVVKLVFGFLSLMINGISNFTPKRK